jgi:uncharacterized small protein (DUF1192 family)
MNEKHRERTQRIQETGGRLRGGTRGNVWEWGPQSSREDYLMEMDDDAFESLMLHMDDVTTYQAKIALLEEEIESLKEENSSISHNLSRAIDNIP